jgi:archaellum component FlaG (FlaF/FlaG flagellin family)
MKRSVKYISFLITVILTVCVAYGLYFYFDPMKSVSGRKADYKVTDIQLLNDFTASSSSAEAKYNDKILEISGILKKTEIQDNACNVIFDKGGTVVLVTSFIPSENEDVRLLSPGVMLHLKGVYKGFIKGDDVFGTPSEIKIDQCTILK